MRRQTQHAAADRRAPLAASAELADDFDEASGLLQRRVFNSPRVFAAETLGVFHRAWLFLGPADWVCEPGDWIATRMGPDPVLLWRGTDGVLAAYSNRCPASARSLCPPGRGSASEIVCSCHGWGFQPDGASRVGGPALSKIARLTVYKELVFACRSQTGPTLEAQIGDFSWYLDMMLDRLDGGLQAIGGDAFRTVIKADWKLAVSHFCGDLYSEETAHAATNAVLGRETPQQKDGFQVTAGGGAMSVLETPAAIGRAARPWDVQARVDVANRLGEARASMLPLTGALFPNLTFERASGAFQVWHPIGPGRTEVHTYCLVDRRAPDTVKDAARRGLQLEYGPGGLRMQDLERPWLAITAGARRGRAMSLNLQMGLNADQSRNLPGRTGALYSELGQRGFFAWWRRHIGDAPDQPPPDLLRLLPSKAGGA